MDIIEIFYWYYGSVISIFFIGALIIDMIIYKDNLWVRGVSIGQARNMWTDIFGLFMICPAIFISALMLIGLSK